MRIQLSLFVPPQYAAGSEQFLNKAGSLSGITITKFKTGQFNAVVPDINSEAGRVLLKHADVLGATDSGPVMLIKSAIYDSKDILKAKLLKLSIGSLIKAIEDSSIAERYYCSECDMCMPRQSIKTGAQIISKKIAEIDMFRYKQLWFFHKDVVDALHECKGLITKPAGSPEGTGPFFEVTGKHDIGYTTHAVRWSNPCPVCGLRAGNSTGICINGYFEYPEKAWNGDDFVISNVFNMLFISRKAYSIITDKKWRTSGIGIEVNPVYLIPDIEPILPVKINIDKLSQDNKIKR